MFKYLRVIPSVTTQDDMVRSQEDANQRTGGVIHMMDSTKWMTLDEIALESSKYNEDWHEEAFTTDLLTISQCISVLVDVGLARASLEGAIE